MYQSCANSNQIVGTECQYRHAIGACIIFIATYRCMGREAAFVFNLSYQQCARLSTRKLQSKIESRARLTLKQHSRGIALLVVRSAYYLLVFTNR